MARDGARAEQLAHVMVVHAKGGGKMVLSGLRQSLVPQLVAWHVHTQSAMEMMRQSKGHCLGQNLRRRARQENACFHTGPNHLLGGGTTENLRA